MKPIIVTEGLIEDLIRDMAPRVEAATGWDIRVGTLRSCVVPKDRGYEEILLGRLRGLGIRFAENEKRGLVERLVEYIVEGNALGAYEPSTERLLVIRENVDESNLDGLRLVVAHELVHRGQHVNHEHLFRRVDAAMRGAFHHLLRGNGTIKGACAKINAIKPTMTLLESHAYHVQESLRQSHFPNAVIESHFNLPALLLRLFGGAKISQYREGIPAVARAVQRGDIDSIYRSI